MDNRILEREKWIDAVRGFGIILVILGHTYGISPILHKYIYSFHMPMFFIISGYLFNSEKIRNMKFTTFLKQKSKSYILPYFLYSFLNLFIQIIFEFIVSKKIISIKELLNYCFYILYCYADVNKMPNCSPVWFLMCLFISSLLLYFCCKYLQKFSVIFIVICLSLSYSIYLFMDFRLPCNISTAFMAVGFMWLGMQIKKFKIIDKIINTKTIYFSLIQTFLMLLGMLAAYYNSDVDMNNNKYGNLLLFLLSSITISFSFLCIFNKVNIFKNKLFTYLGKNSILIIGFNYIVRDFMIEVYYFLPIINKIVAYNWVILFFLTTVSFLIIIPIRNEIKKRLRF